MGINIPTREELIANTMGPNELAEYVEADSLAYLSVAGLKQAVKLNMNVTDPDQNGHCTACLTGEYPGGLPEELSW